MKFDANVMQTLLQLLGNKQPCQNNDTETTCKHKDSYQYRSAFAQQNGIGNPVQDTFACKACEHDDKCNTQQSPLNMLELLAKIMPNKYAKTSDNFPLSMLINMLMPKQQNKDCHNENNMDICNNDCYQCKNNTIKSNLCDLEDKNHTQRCRQNIDDNHACSCHSDGCVHGTNSNPAVTKTLKEKTQLSFFAPVAFAGYNVVCTLCKLYITSRFDLDK